jgi:hypothetical protein
LQRSLYAAKSLTKETYRLALPLCIEWDLKDLQIFILSELEKVLSLLERYVLARELRIPEWERYCLGVLVTRPMGLTVDEGRQLGVEAVIFISSLREDARTRSRCLHTCITCDSKKRVSGKSIDMPFVQAQVQQWLDHNN